MLRKKITGVVIKNQEKRIPNKLHKVIHEKFHQLEKDFSNEVRQKTLNRLRSLANYANQIQSTNWVERIKRKEKELLSSK